MVNLSYDKPGRVTSLSRQDIVIVGITLALVVGTWTLYSVLHPGIDSTDRNVVATAILKDKDPTLFSRDTLFSYPEIYGYYTPLYRWIVGLVWEVGGSFEVGFILLLPLVMGGYLLGMFILLNWVTGSSWIALGLTVAAAHYHNVMGASGWGVGDSGSLGARTVFMPAAPFIFLLLLELIQRPGWRSGAAFGLLLGLATNLHPISGFHLFVLSLVFLMLIRGVTSKSLRAAIAAGTAAFLGAVPIVWHFAGSAGKPVDNETTFETFSKIVGELYSIPFSPPSFEWPLLGLEITRPVLDGLVWVYLTLSILAFLAYVWLRYRWKNPAGASRFVVLGWLVGGLITLAYAYLLVLFESTFLFLFLALYVVYRFWRGGLTWLEGLLLAFISLIILYSFVGYYIFTFTWQTFELLPLTSFLTEYARAAAFIYLPLYLLAGVAGVTWAKDLAQSFRLSTGWRKHWGGSESNFAFAIAAILALGPGILFGYLPLPPVKLLGPEGLTPQPLYEPAHAELYSWVQENTPKTALFYGCFGPVTMTHFRFRAQRSISHNWKDLTFNLHHRASLAGAYERFRELESGCKRFDGMVSTAHSLQADYILVSSEEAAEFLHQACFVNEKYAVFTLDPKGCPFP